MATDPTPDSKPPAAGTPSAMTPHAIGVALFAAFVVGGILAKVVPLWVVVLVGLVVGAAVFVLVDRYSRLPWRTMDLLLRTLAAAPRNSSVVRQGHGAFFCSGRADKNGRQ